MEYCLFNTLEKKSETNIRYTAISYPGVYKQQSNSKQRNNNKKFKQLTFFFYYPRFLMHDFNDASLILALNAPPGGM